MERMAFPHPDGDAPPVTRLELTFLIVGAAALLLSAVIWPL
jgi:hypothetical protein